MIRINEKQKKVEIFYEDDQLALDAIKTYADGICNDLDPKSQALFFALYNIVYKTVTHDVDVVEMLKEIREREAENRLSADERNPKRKQNDSDTGDRTDDVQGGGQPDDADTGGGK